MAYPRTKGACLYQTVEIKGLGVEQFYFTTHLTAQGHFKLMYYFNSFVNSLSSGIVNDLLHSLFMWKVKFPIKCTYAPNTSF